MVESDPVLIAAQPCKTFHSFFRLSGNEKIEIEVFDKAREFSSEVVVILLEDINMTSKV